MKFIKLWLIMCLIMGCTHENNTKEMYMNLLNQTIILPSVRLYSIDGDSVKFAHVNDFKIVMYEDSMGCLSCKMRLHEWDEFIAEINDMTQGRVDFLIYVNPSSVSELDRVLRIVDFKHPICIDVEDEFNKCNNLPEDDRFRCFLLDKDNNIVCIGNPTSNSEIKNIYIQEIERCLDISRDIGPSNQSLYSNLGAFGWNTSRETLFVLHNMDSVEWHVDSIFTSCECTKAYISSMDIKPDEEAVVNVCFKADRPEKFHREVYVCVNGKKHITLTIEGEAR